MVLLLIVLLDKKDLKKLQNRDTHIFEKLYLEYKDKVYNFLLIKTKRNYELTEELFSNTFHSALVSAPNIKSSKNIQG